MITLLIEVFPQSVNQSSLILPHLLHSEGFTFFLASFLGIGLVSDALSIEQSIAGLFQLKPYSDVIAKKVTREEVELDSVELTFKDQYLGRSEMWRLKNSLVTFLIDSSISLIG